MPRVTITIPNKQAQPYRFPLDRDDITLGRSRDNDIPIQSESVSVRHANMRRVPGGYELRDLGSTNGLKVEGEKKIFVPLHSGMTVRIGEADFYFQLSDEEQEELKKEAPADQEEDAEGTKKVEEPKKKKKEKKRKSDDEEESDGEEDSGWRDGATSRSGKIPSVSSGGMIIVFLILAAVAFFVGMSIRHEKETGGSLLDSIRAKFQAKEEPAAEPKPVE